MKSLIFSSLIVFLFLVQTIDCEKQSPKCNEKTRERIDNLVAQVVPVLNGVKLPENERQLQKYCGAVSEAMDSATEYVKSCGGTLGPLISRIVSQEYNKEMNAICKLKDIKRVKEKLSFSRCVNSAAPKLKKCAHYAIDSMMTVKSVPFGDRVTTACCQSHKFFSCTMKALFKTKRCDEEMVKKIEREVLTHAGDMCGTHFGDTNQCKKLLSKVAKLDKSYVRPKSVFIPLMNVMDSFRNMECTAQNEQTMDSMLARMLTIGTPDKIPEKSLQLTQWCSNAMHNMPYFYGYVESCLSEFGRLLVKIASGAVVTTDVKSYCGPEAKYALDNPNPEMQEYINAAKCGNKAEKKLKVCFDNFNENLLAISEAPEMSRIKMACCNGYDFRTCVYNATISTKGCSLRTIEWAEREIMQAAEGAIIMVCADHWGGPKCDRLLTQIPKLDKSKYKAPKSPFFPIMKLLDSFSDVD